MLAEIGGAFGIYVGEKKMGLWWRNMRERDNQEDVAVDASVILKLILQEWEEVN
jgi:hypothetical protein